MLIPLNNSKRENLALSVVRIKQDYSVTIVSIINGYGMSSIPSYMHNIHTDECDACACIEDYEIVKGADLYNCIEKCLEQLND